MCRPGTPMRVGRVGRERLSAYGAPVNASSSSAASSTVRVIGPTSQIVGAANAPEESMSPWVGFRPTTPQFDAGWRTEPPASVPNAAGQMPLATATAEPLLDPIARWVRLQGFRGGGQRSSSLGMLQANSFRLSLASTAAPAPRIAATE